MTPLMISTLMALGAGGIVLVGGWALSKLGR